DAVGRIGADGVQRLRGAFSEPFKAVRLFGPIHLLKQSGRLQSPTRARNKPSSGKRMPSLVRRLDSHWTVASGEHNNNPPTPVQESTIRTPLLALVGELRCLGEVLIFFRDNFFFIMFMFKTLFGDLCRSLLENGFF